MVLVLISALVVCVVGGCRRATATATKEDAAASAPFTVREDSQGLLFTWIDEKGDFHVEQKVSDVPVVGRDAVRAVDPAREETSHGDTVYVADLRVANLDGSYPVHTMARDDFDALALTRREKGGQLTLATVTARDAGTPGARAAGAADEAFAGRPAVIVYGASWCSACHQAMAYFKKRGITFIEKDIENDPQAAEEMNGKLRRAGLRGGSIPVLDVRGRVFVGFDPRTVEEALGSPI
ncbi:MAG: glutaredoxin family protein [Polyangiaceae bacterium]